MARPENKKYWDILFTYDDADKKGASAHNIIVNDLIIDYEVFEKLWPPQDAGLIISEPGRFGGLLPYLFNHGYQDLYQKAFSIITRKLKENFVEMIPIAVSLLHFSALQDKENYLVVKAIFEDAKRNPNFKPFDWNGKLKDAFDTNVE